MPDPNKLEMRTQGIPDDFFINAKGEALVQVERKIKSHWDKLDEQSLDVNK